MNDEQLTKRETDCLGLADADLFRRGACHVLAVVLKRSGRWAPCELVRVPAVRDSQPIGAYHVYAKKGDDVLDITGKRKETELLDDLDRHLKQIGAKGFNSGISRPPQPIDEKELLTRDRRDMAGAWVNAWGLFSGNQFIVGATDRAESVIKRWSEQGTFS